MPRVIEIRGHSDLYDGWLHAVLLLPCPTDANEAYKQGYKMAIETGIHDAITVLQAEIRFKHILCEAKSQ